MQTALLGLAAILAAVALAPLVTDAVSRWLVVPLPVAEIVLGILIGPAVLGLAEPGGLPQLLGRMGIAAIIYLAGYELDYGRITRGELRWASVGWVISLALGLLTGLGVTWAADAVDIPVRGDGSDLLTAGVFVGIAVTSTALSTALPALRDAGETRTAFGRAVIAAGAVGQLAPLVALSVIFGGRELWRSAVALAIFSVLVLLALRVARRGLPAWARGVMAATLHSSGHFAVRLIVAVIALLAAVSVDVFEVDFLVGAFAAGALVRQLMNSVDETDRTVTEQKVHGIAFGFLTPLFFVTTGIAFDLRGLLAEPLTLALIPVFLVVMLVARGLPASLVLPRHASVRDRFAAMLWTSLGLAVVVVVVDVAVREGHLSTVMGSAMVGAGMISLLAFPTLALAVRHPSPADELR